ncbi:transcription termination factor NusA [Patescibacteria group bacterium]|nr:transcription termination factor NusA [Patescibacteria group bacterium]
MSEISNAIKQICDEKSLSYEAVITTIESALAAAYRKDFGERNQNIKVEFDPEAGKSKVFDVKTVVEDMPEEEDAETSAQGGCVPDAEEKKAEQTETSAQSAQGGQDAEEKRRFNPKTEIQLTDAKLIKKTAKIGDEIKTKLTVPDAYGRMAAQTAKQVIIQKLREAEREMIFNEFKEKEHEVVAGVIQRHEGRIVLIDLGKTAGILPGDEQIRGEQYNPGQRIKVFIKEVNITSRGPEIILSRTSDEILKKVFYLEIPEISNGLVEIKSVAREAGSRSKVAVSATGENVDPIGSCVGQRGARIQTIISELGGEKIDIIEYNENLAKFVANALSPAKTLSVNIDEKNKKALVNVAEDQLSLAIGRDGQNVRLAARLTGWRIDITGEKAGKAETEKEEKAEGEKEEAKTEEIKTTEETEKKKKNEPKKEDKPKKKSNKSKSKK